MTSIPTNERFVFKLSVVGVPHVSSTTRFQRLPTAATTFHRIVNHIPANIPFHLRVSATQQPHRPRCDWLETASHQKNVVFSNRRTLRTRGKRRDPIERPEIRSRARPVNWQPRRPPGSAEREAQVAASFNCCFVVAEKIEHDLQGREKRTRFFGHLIGFRALPGWFGPVLFLWLLLDRMLVLPGTASIPDFYSSDPLENRPQLSQTRLCVWTLELIWIQLGLVDLRKENPSLMHSGLSCSPRGKRGERWLSWGFSDWPNLSPTGAPVNPDRKDTTSCAVRWVCPWWFSWIL